MHATFFYESINVKVPEKKQIIVTFYSKGLLTNEN